MDKGYSESDSNHSPFFLYFFLVRILVDLSIIATTFASLHLSFPGLYFAATLLLLFSTSLIPPSKNTQRPHSTHCFPSVYWLLSAALTIPFQIVLEL